MDNYVLYGPGGASPLNIGSWANAGIGPDFGADQILKAEYSENPAVEGGQLIWEQSFVRRMKFPLTVAPGSLSVPVFESLLRSNARPGGYIDLQPENVASAESVRFDILAGRWVPAYSIYHQRLPRRVGVLELDTMPYGYWPTWISLVAVGDQKTPFRTSVPVASLIGDAPGAVRMTVRATAASWNGFVPTSTDVVYYPDVLAWSLGGPSQFLSPLRAASAGRAVASGWYQQGMHGTYFNETTDADGLSATSILQFLTPSDLMRFRKVGAYQIDPGAFGRYRVFAYARFQPSSAVPLWLTADVVDVDPYWGEPLASGNNIATVTPHVGSVSAGGLGAWGYVSSQAHQLVDLGELTLPRSPAGSGLASQGAWVRVWAGGTVGYAIASSAMLATYTLYLNSLVLIPADGPHGFVPRGLSQPQSLAVNSVFMLGINSYDRAVGLANTWSATTWPDSFHTDGQRWHRGDYPYVSPTAPNLTILSANRRWTGSAYGQAAHYGAQKASVYLEYRPRFQFLKGL